MPQHEREEVECAQVPAEEASRRLAAFQGYLCEAKLDGAFLLQRADLYYFCGTAHDAVCYVPAAGEPLLAVRRPLERARKEAVLSRVVPLPSYSVLPALLAEHGLGGARRVGMEHDVLPVQLHQRFHQLFREVEFVDASPLVMKVRQRKSPIELECFRQAAAAVEAGHRWLPAMLREGLVEVEALAHLLTAFRQAGGEGSARMRRWDHLPLSTTMLSGWNGAVPSFVDATTGGEGLNRLLPFGSSRKTLRAGEPILVDSVCTHAGYCVDLSRTYAIRSLADELRDAHALAVEILHHLEGMLRPGMPSGDLYASAVAMAGQTQFGDAFLGHGPNKVSFVGHGIGLEVNEPPFIARGFTTPFEVGMVVAVEPKFVFPGKGIVGIENTYVITEGSPERLTTLPDDLVIVS